MAKKTKPAADKAAAKATKAETVKPADAVKPIATARDTREETVARGHTVKSGRKYYEEGEKVVLAKSEADRLRAKGAIVDADFRLPTGTGPNFSEKRESKAPRRLEVR